MAHRISWEIHRGPIPPGLHVCHKCDTPSCVNPDHLFLGTAADNMADKCAKGRGNFRRGMTSGRAKLTDADVVAIRADRRLQAEIAEAYGVSNPIISRIKSRKIWAHVA
jgi:hypothetical protein